MALFGAPLAEEDHAVRALSSAFHLQRAIDGYGETVSARWAVPFRMDRCEQSGRRSVHAHEPVGLRSTESRFGLLAHRAQTALAVRRQELDRLLHRHPGRSTSWPGPTPAAAGYSVAAALNPKAAGPSDGRVSCSSASATSSTPGSYGTVPLRRPMQRRQRDPGPVAGRADGVRPPA